MSTILDYIAWRGDLTLDIVPFNEIDALIFCEFAYLKLRGIVPEKVGKDGIPLETAARLFFEAPDVVERSDMGILFGKAVVELFQLMATTPRYKNLRLCGFDHDGIAGDQIDGVEELSHAASGQWRSDPIASANHFSWFQHRDSDETA